MAGGSDLAGSILTGLRAALASSENRLKHTENKSFL